MILYEINEQIIAAFDEAIDPETGELIDEEAYDRLNQLQENFEEKVENLALYVKDLKAQALALKAEKRGIPEAAESGGAQGGIHRKISPERLTRAETDLHTRRHFLQKE